ncbi:class I/II family aminotransferase [Myxococcus stipitatus DSM 14675]|uniref:Class I/II family aminotransferase n=1 Tax=Myxococcus stipitatus (strain DSM 14675 / JCM 12634 / Mx s8) TaxID=1278073 RepID=L7U9Z9_MYXSD|nr:PLP-dependent aminotransferase family protein [Myxococcus stipitatus]AGC45771.1 class I/II family aminotransferase [Myxococcus stipitatus DSM 14675]
MTSPTASFENSLAGWARKLAPSAIQDMLQKITRPGVYSLALGLPAAELFPKEGMAEAAAKVLAEQGGALQYSPTLEPLREQVVRLMARRGVSCSPSQVFLTTGAQQGMNLLARLLLEPGQAVLLEDRVYSGFQQVLDPFQSRRLTVRRDVERGLDLDGLESLLASGERPGLFYTMSDGHNPLGTSLAMEARERLVRLAREYRMPVIEDDAYGFLQYEEEGVLPPLRALDSQWVFYVGSFSKILAPALRVGWVVVPESLVFRLATVKESSDIDTATFTQRIVLAFLESGGLDGHLERLRKEYRLRRDTLLRALETHLPAGAKWSRPSHGMFVWVELPEGRDTTVLLARALETQQVAYLPGQAFMVNGGRSAAHCMRLNFSHCEPARIEEAVRRLGGVLREAQG